MEKEKKRKRCLIWTALIELFEQRERVGGSGAGAGAGAYRKPATG